MSQTIDTKVVEMEFDNRQFEKNVGVSLKTLDKLKKSLQFEDTSDGLEQVSKSIKKLDFSQAAQSVIVLHDKFSIFERMAIGALEDLGRSIERNLVSKINSVTLDPISKGWSKYAEKTQSVQTIMAATGKTIDDVNAQLDKLNWFTDETSYNFLDMVKNIGKFTSNRIPLEESVTAMQGISTWAAISGANVGEASRAMYNLSQAMSVGAVKLIDWKSIENANMATAEFKQTVIDTAVELGTLTKAGEDAWKTVNGAKEVTVKNFNENLKQEWFTSDVLMKALDRYGGFSVRLGEVYEQYEDQVDTTSKWIEMIDKYVDGSLDMAKASAETGIAVKELQPLLEELGSEEYELGRKAFKAAQEAKTFGEAIDSVKDAASTAWMNTFELIFGNYEEAKRLWTDLANSLYEVFVTPVNNLNSLLEKALGEQPKKFVEQSMYYLDVFKMGLSKDDETTLRGIFMKMARDHGVAIDTMIRQDGSFWKTLKNGWLTNDMFTELLDKVTGEQVQDIEKIREAAADVIRGNYGDDWDTRAPKLIAEGYDAEQVRKYVNALHKATGGTWDLTEAAYAAADAELDLTTAVSTKSDAELKAMGFTDKEIEVLRKLKQQAEETGTPLNELIASWYEDRPSGRELLIESMSNILGNLVTVINAVSEAFGEVFVSDGIEGLAVKFYEFLEKFHELSENLVLSEENTEKLKNAFAGLFSIFRLVLNVLTSAAKVVLPVLGAAIGFVAQIVLDLASAAGTFITGFVDKIVDNQTVLKFFEGLAESIKAFVLPLKDKAIESFRGGLIGIIKSLAGFDKLSEENQGIIEKILGDKSTLGLIGEVIHQIGLKFRTARKAIKEFIEPLKTNIIEKFRGGLIDIIKRLSGFDKLPKGAQDLMDQMYKSLPTTKLLGDAFKEVGSTIAVTFDNLRNKFKDSAVFKNIGTVFDNTFSNIKAKFDEFVKGFQNGENPILEWFDGLRDTPVIGSILEFFDNIKEKIKGFFSKDGTGGGIFDGIKEYFENISPDADLFTVAHDLFESLKAGFDDAIEKIKNYFGNGKWIEDIKAGIAKIFGKGKNNSIKEAGVDLEDSFKSLSPDTENLSIFDKLLNVFENVKNGVIDFKDSVVAAFKAAGGGLEGIKDAITAAIGSIGKAFGNADMGKISGGVSLLIGLITAVLTAVGVKKIFKGIMSLVDSFKEMIGKITDIAKAEAEARKAAAEAQKLKAWTAFIVGIASSVLIIAVAIKIIADIPTKDLIKAGITVVAIGAFIAILAFVLSKMTKNIGSISGGIRDVGIGVLAFALGLLVIYFALNLLKNLSLEGIEGSVLGMLAIIGILLLVAAKMNGGSSDLKGSAAKAASIIAFALSIYIVASVVGKLAKLIKKYGNNMWKAIGMLAVIVGGLYLLMKNAKGFKKGSGVGLLAVAASLNLMVRAIKQMAKIKAETLMGAILPMITIVGMIVVLMKASQSAGKYALKGGVAILLIAVAINLLIIPIKVLGSMNPDEAMAGVAAVIALMLGITILLIAIKNAGKHAIKAGIAALLIAGAVGILAGAVAALALIDQDKLIGATLALGSLMVVFSLLMALSKFASIKITTILGYVVLLGAIVAALWVLTQFDTNKLTTAVSSLRDVLLSVVAVMAVATLIGSNPVSGFSSALGIVVFIGTLVAALALISAAIDILPFTPEQIKTQIEKLCPIFDAIGSLIGSLLHGVIGKLNAGDLSSQIEPIKELVTFISSLYNSGDLPASSSSGLLEFLAGKTNSGLDVLARDAASLLAPIAKFANDMSGLDLSDVEGGVSIAKDLTTFVIGLYGDPNVEKLKGLSDDISIMEWMCNKTGSGLDIVGKDMTSLAGGIRHFSRALKLIGIGGDKLSEKLGVAEDLTSFVIGLYNGTGDAKLPEASKSSVWEWMAGKSNSGLDVVGKDMVSLGGGLRKFSTVLNVLKSDNKLTEKLGTAQELTSFVIGLYNATGDDALPAASKSSVWEWMAGKSNSGLDVVGKDMVSLGGGLRKFAVALNLLKVDGNLADKVDTVKDLTTFVIGLYGDETFPDVGKKGIYEWFTGKTGTKVETLGEDAGTLAEGLGKFATIIGGSAFSEDSEFTSKVAAAQRLATFISGLYDTAYTSLPSATTDSVYEWYAKKTNSGVEAIGLDATTLAEGLANFAKIIGESEFSKSSDFTDKIAASQHLADFLVGLYQKTELPPEGTESILEWANARNEGNALAEIGVGATALATGLSDYANTISTTTFNPSKILASYCLGKMLVSLNGSIPDSSVIDVIQGGKLKNFANQLPTLGEKMVEYSNKIKDLDTENVNKATEAAQMLADLSASLKEVNLGDGWFKEGDLDIFSMQVANFGYALEILSGTGDVEMPDVNVERLDVISDAISAITGLALNINEVIANGDRLKEFGTLLVEISKWPWSEIEAVDASNLEPLKTTLEELSGIIESEELTEAKEKITAIGEVVGSWTELLEAFQGAGENIGLGLVQGINSTDVSQAAYDLAQAFLTEFKNELIIESPSKVMEEMGGYIDEGLALGVTNNTGQVETAASELGGTLTETLSETTDSLPDAITDPAAIQTAFQGLLAAMGASVDGNVGILLNSFKGVGDTVVQYLAGSKDIFRSLGYESSNAFSGAVKDSVPVTKETVLGILKTFYDFRDDGKAAANALGSWILSGFNDIRGDARIPDKNTISGTIPAALIGSGGNSLLSVLKGENLGNKLFGGGEAVTNSVLGGMNKFRGDARTPDKKTVGGTIASVLGGSGANSLASFLKSKNLGGKLFGGGEAVTNSVLGGMNKFRGDARTPDKKTVGGTISSVLIGSGGNSLLSVLKGETLGNKLFGGGNTATKSVLGGMNKFRGDARTPDKKTVGGTIPAVLIGEGGNSLLSVLKGENLGKKLFGGGEAVGTSVAEGESSKSDTVQSILPNAVGAGIDDISAKGAEGGTGETAGSTVAGAVESGESSKSDDIKSAITSPVSSGIAAVDAMGNDNAAAYNAGYHVGTGIANGMGATLSIIFNKGAVLGQEAINGVNSVPGINAGSPSKKSFKSGVWVGQGLINGMASLRKNVRNAASDVGATAIDGVASSVSTIADIVENGLDADPVIRPVLDLSNVQAGASAIDGYLSFGTPYSVMANVNGINSMMNGRQHRMSSADVVDAINRLGDSMPQGGATTYNVNGVTYDDGTNVADAVRSLIRAANINRRA